jgi:glycine hydroxymethyltransferase
MILWNNEEYSKKINSAIFPGTQGGPLMNIIAAKAQCFSEALEANFAEYADAVIRHARTLIYELHRLGIPTLTMGTDSHIVLIDLRGHSVSGKYVADRLEENGITVNKNGVPNDPRSFTETSGIRIGTAAETTRLGTNADNKFREIAQTIAEVINGTIT